MSVTEVDTDIIREREEGNIESLLERYLLGLLASDQRDEVERWFFGDVARLEHLALVEESLMEKYVAGELGSLERQRFESDFLISEDRIRGVRLLSGIYSLVPRLRNEPKYSSAVGQLSLEPPTVLAALQKLRVSVVRFARWAGWLYFVDQELLERFFRHHQQQARK